MNRDYFAEMYVAGILADRNWNIYFPRRDRGFDMIITRETENQMLVRPVQVKGKYPREAKTNKKSYGYVGELSQLHPDMVLVIPFFPVDVAGVAPLHIAYMPHSGIRTSASKGFACMPAKFTNGKACPRPGFERYFDSQGLVALESPKWGADGFNNWVAALVEAWQVSPRAQSTPSSAHIRLTAFRLLRKFGNKPFEREN